FLAFVRIRVSVVVWMMFSARSKGFCVKVLAIVRKYQIILKFVRNREDGAVRVRLDAAGELGPLVKSVRRSQGLRQDATAEGVGVSENFLAKVERGSETVQWGKLFAVLAELGMHVEIDIPAPVAAGIDSQAKAQR